MNEKNSHLSESLSFPIKYTAATSALDSASEHHVKEAIDSAMKGRTVLSIAHRLSTVRNADRILFLEKGRIENEGTHKELIRNNEKYKKLADLQFL